MDIWLLEFLQIDTAPVLAPKVATWTRSLRIICPVPLASRVRASSVPVVMSVAAPEMVTAPVLKVLSNVVAPCRVKAPGVVTDPMVFTDEAPDPKVLVVLAPVAKVVLPEEVNVVNAPVPGVAAPMETKLARPAAVIFQLLSAKERVSEIIVTVSAAAPIKMLSAPASFMVTSPVAVRVVVDTPVAPDIAPSSLMVRLGVPPDLISKAVLVPALVSSRIKEATVPCWVKVKDWSVAKSAKVKAMFLALVVVMVLPEAAS